MEMNFLADGLSSCLMKYIAGAGGQRMVGKCGFVVCTDTHGTAITKCLHSCMLQFLACYGVGNTGYIFFYAAESRGD